MIFFCLLALLYSRTAFSREAYGGVIATHDPPKVSSARSDVIGKAQVYGACKPSPVIPDMWQHKILTA